MIEKAIYEKLLNKFGDVASWAIWSAPYDKSTANVGDMKVFDRGDLLSILNSNYVFVGLNGSGVHDSYMKINLPWHNFHSSSPNGKDYRLRFTLAGTEYWGSYITDLFKHLPELHSEKVDEIVKENPEIIQLNIALLEEELKCLGEPVVVALGDSVERYLRKYLKGYHIIKIKHYSSYVRLDAYRDEALFRLGKGNRIEKAPLSADDVVSPQMSKTLRKQVISKRKENNDTMNRKDLQMWYCFLTEATEGTDYEAMYNGGSAGNKGVAIVPRGMNTPQRLCIYPKKTKNAGLVVEEDIYDNLRLETIIGKPDRVKSGRPHYNDISDDKLIQICYQFLGIENIS